MHVSETRGAIKAGYLVLAGCGVLLAWILVAALRNRNDVVMSPAAALAAIGALHGVGWPSNTVTTAFVIWNYRSASDGNSHNTETLAKLETDDDSFLIWYSNATNILSEHRHASAPYDARLSEKAKWWRPDELGETNDGLLSHELSQPTGVHSKLSIFVSTTGTNRVIYLHCIVRQP
jgi:hypothetical protein